MQVSDRELADIPPGRVYWITGLAGAGKTTLAKGLWKHLRQLGQPAVLLDGDLLRELYGPSQSYDLASRQQTGMRHARLCRWLSEQGLPVVCATISLFESCRSWNRQYLSDYCEIFLDVPLEVLLERDQKGLYSGALAGSIQNVMGVDLEPEWPQNPEIILNNDGSQSPQGILEILLKQLEIL